MAILWPWHGAFVALNITLLTDVIFFCKSVAFLCRILACNLLGVVDDSPVDDAYMDGFWRLLLCCRWGLGVDDKKNAEIISPLIKEIR